MNSRIPNRVHSWIALPGKGEILTLTHKMERLSGIKIHIDRVESHKHPGSLCMSNIPLGADHCVLLPRFKIQLHKRFKCFYEIKTHARA